MSPEFLQEIKTLVLKQEIIEAKTLLFQHFGNLSEAKAFLETLLPTSRAGQKHNNEVLALLQQGEKIQAIKLVRNINGWDLRASKDYIDALQQELGL